MISPRNPPPRLELRPYAVGLKPPWPGAPRRRRGWWLAAHRGPHTGWGECAPMEAAGTESVEAAAACLSRLVRADEPPDPARVGRQAPAVACALDTALLDLAGRESELSLRRLLGPDAAGRVAVNALAGPPEQARVRAAVEAGFRVIKCKIGRDGPEPELERLHALAADLPPGVLLRLDANRAWTPAQALRFLHGLRGLPVESLEEPLRTPSVGTLRALQEATDVPLALDESFRPLGGAALFARFPVARVVLKPMVQGGLRPTRILALQALEAGVVPVITSVFETALGLHAAAQLAAALAGEAALPPHGLATASWLLEDPVPPPVLDAGHLFLPDRPGLGVQPP